MYVNKVILIGNLTRDPELKSLPSGSKVANFSIATNRTWKDANGKKQESTDYHNVVVFGKQAEIVSQYLKKGSQAFVEGRLQTRSWDGNDGKKQYRTEIVSERVQFGSRPNQNQQPGGVYRKTEGDEAKNDAPSKGVEEIEYPSDELNPEDIPF